MGVKCSEYCKCDECKNVAGPNDHHHEHTKHESNDISKEE